MKYFIFSGGLGNQMFQYAMLLSLRNHGAIVRIDRSLYRHVKMHNGFELNRVFGIEEETIDRGGIHLIWLRLLNKYKPSIIYSKDSLHFNSAILDNPRKYIEGYWQSELYFKDIAQQVKNAFVFKNIDSMNASYASNMRECESVSLHIRRGDYASYGMALIGNEYYEKAVEIIRNKIGEVRFFIFSDDAAEARKMADKMGINYQIMNHNLGRDSYKDMYLMSQCKHNIIANSSFSWWGAWLNNFPHKIVIAPKWLYDFNCKTWIEL